MKILVGVLEPEQCFPQGKLVDTDTQLSKALILTGMIKHCRIHTAKSK